MRRSRNNIQIIYPVNTNYPNTAPPRYTASDQTEEIQLEDNDTSSVISSGQCQNSSELGIENPTFEDEEETVATSETNTETAVILDDQSITNNGDNINTITDFSYSIGEVTHL